MWSAFWKWKEDFPEGEEEGEEEVSQDGWREGVGAWGECSEGQRRKERRFEGKMTRMPTALPYRWKEAIGKYCEAVKEDIIRGIRRSPRDNLTMEARVALKELQERVKGKEWAVRPADKGGGVTVEPYAGVVEDGREELRDESTFKRVEKLGVNATIRKVEGKLKDLRDRGCITTKMRENLSAKNTKEGVMKINRKVHKKVKENGRHPTRVYISGIGTPTEGIAGLVEEELREGVEGQRSFVQDTADFLRKLEEVGRLEEGDFMFVMDVVALYPSVPRERAREAMRRSLEQRKIKKIPTEDVMEMSEIILGSNEFSFEGEEYLQKEGTAIGSKMGKNYACTFMGLWEEEVEEKARKELGKVPRWWKRFVDDVFGIWRGTQEEFEEFVKLCNGHEERIKVTYEICQNEAIFLDVMVKRKEGGKMVTELYVKPTDRTRYLHKDSDHPQHVKEGIAKGQARRLRRVCSDDEGYWKYAEMVKKKLVSRGYGEQGVKRQLKEGFKMSREEALKRAAKKKDERINFVLTHSAYLPKVGEILKRHGHYLREDGLEKYVEQLPRLSLRKGKNIADLVVNAKPKRGGGGSRPCGKGCKLCKHMEEVDEVEDQKGRKLRLRGMMDCRTVGAVYGMWCRRCEKVVYVGKTMNRVMDRFMGHRADMKGDDESKPAFHFKKDGHSEDEMGVIVLEQVGGKDDTYRVQRERWWMNQMGVFDEENKRR